MAATLEYSTSGTTSIYNDDWNDAWKIKSTKSLYKIFYENSIINEKYINEKYEKNNEYIIRPNWYTNDATTTATSPYLNSTTSTSYTNLDDFYNAVSGYYRWAKGKAEWVDSGIRLDPMARMREIIRSRQAPTILIARSARRPEDDREIRARQTLRTMIGEDAFMKFLKKGFVSVRAKSGRIYQIFPGHKSTVVWENGKAIKSICVYLRGGFAPTDEVIMRYILITTDEEDFWKRGNVGNAYPRSRGQQRTIDFRPLPEILAELKRVA